MKKKKLSLLLVIVLGIFFTSNTNVKALENYVWDSAPDSFTTNDNDTVLANTEISKHVNVFDYHTKEMKKVFCYDRKINYNPASKVYTKTAEEVDYPVVYIISHAIDYYKQLDSTGVTEQNQKYEMSWMTQIAIWIYQNADNFASINSITPNIFKETEETVYSARADKLFEKALQLVTAAKSAANPASDVKLNVSSSNKYSVDKDNKTIRTSLITVDKTNISSYKLDISKAPKGTKVYAGSGANEDGCVVCDSAGGLCCPINDKENGTEITDLGNITVDKFYLVFPIDNAENYTYDFNLGISTDNYVYYKGYKYTNTEGNQPLVIVAPDNKTLNASLNLKGSHVEDTASSIANSIYFVGFLILITGIGIIYANVKTKKEEV